MAETDTIPWWQEGVIYQIYPRSFMDSNGDGIGDLNGILMKLDYLADLGVDAIWLSPIYPSPDVDFGYDVSDYLSIDPKFGNLQDFDHLISAAHERGIRVILDLVLNHTSDRHPWFKAARSSRDNPYHDWYIWKDSLPNHRPPNNWQSIFGGSAWEYVPELGQYYYHMFYKEQPDLNWHNSQVKQAMLDVIRFWLERGVDGFRLDVFNVYFKHADFPDNPSALGLRGFDRQKHMYDVDQPELLPLLAEIRQMVDQYPQRYLVGETFLSTAERAAKYCSTKLLHAAFNFEFLQCPWNPAHFLNTIQRWETALQQENGWPNYVLNNHDTPRSATRYVKGENDECLKVLAMLLLTLRGTPFIYYGEEIGMRNISLKRSEILDPVGKRFWPFFKGRDSCRSPMQWDGSLHAGFSKKLPWLPVHPNHVWRNVEAQRADPDSLFNFYRSLIRLRREFSALRTGLFQPLTFDPVSLLAYLRVLPGQTLLIALNFSQKPRRLMLGRELTKKPWELVISSHKQEHQLVGKGYLSLQGYEAVILQQD